MPPKELVDEIDKAYNEYKKEKEKEVDYLTFYNGFVACNRNRQKENNKLLDVINNQDVKIADLEKENAELKSELTKKADTNHSLVEQMADLESENAELKERYDKVDIIGYDALKNFTKANLLLKDVYKIAMDDWNDPKWHDQVLRKAREYIKEIEK